MTHTRHAQRGNMKKIRNPGSNMSVNVIGMVVMLLLVFGTITGTIGYFTFTDAFTSEYAEATYRMADTATTLVNGDHIDDYLAGDLMDEYAATNAYLDVYCHKIHVTIIYVIVVDQSDYGRFVSVFNNVNNDVGNTNYTPWELGHPRDTTNDEYRRKYRAIYEEGSPYETIYRTRHLNGQKPHITTIVPVKDSTGKVVALLCMHRMMNGLTDVLRRYMLIVGVTALGLAVLSALFYALFFHRKLFMPLQTISTEATRFSRENTQGQSLAKVSRYKELRNLGVSIDEMESEMLKYIANLTAATAERERIGAELSVATTIQAASVPNVFPAFPYRKDFDIYASMTPAKEVGGDLYNFFLVDDDHLAFVIGDVSGKGVPAALFMMVTNILLTERVKLGGGTPADVLSFVNDAICAHNEAEMFVTLWLGVLEISTGKVIASNAGHDDAAVYRKDGSFELFKTRHGVVVGAMSGVRYKNFEFTLAKGDKLFLYTDGVPEATDSDKRMFTLQGMLDALNAHKDRSPEGILAGVTDAVNAFVGEAPQFDDLTMLCIELTDAANEPCSLTVEADTANLPRVTDFVTDLLDGAGCSPKARMAVELSVDEIFTNVACYAYGEGTGEVEISASVEDGVLTLVFRDEGVPYDPLAKADPDVTLSADERAIGGLGIFLVKKKMDEVTYAYLDGHNVLTLRKRIS